jgi:hypothetical protein
MANSTFNVVAGVGIAYQDPTCALPQPRKFREPALLCVVCPGTRAWIYEAAQSWSEITGLLLAV